MRDISLETVIAALTYIDAYDRDTWLKVGNALKTEFGTSGFDVFDNWSQTTDNYDAKAIKSVWRSLTIGKVNIGTVIFLAKQRGFDIQQARKQTD
ncbi:MAG: PriCT-2 domain-containing protein [Moraxellaceae bacterium]|nr:PriCT-2 domain-containing protein [Moraxellaceae bacterium]